MTKATRKVASLTSLGIENVELQLPSQDSSDEYVVLRHCVLKAGSRAYALYTYCGDWGGQQG